VASAQSARTRSASLSCSAAAALLRPISGGLQGRGAVPLIDLCFRCSNCASQLTDFVHLKERRHDHARGDKCDWIIGQRDGGDPHSFIGMRRSGSAPRSFQAPARRLGGVGMERIDWPNVYLSFSRLLWTEMMKPCEVLALLLFAALAPDSTTIAVSSSQQMKDGLAVVDLPNVIGMNARDVYSANGERIGELSEIVLDDAHRPVAASIETDEGPGGKEYIVGAEKLRLKGSRLVTSLTRQQLEAMPRVNG
jgi:hypothetical protein